MKDIEFFLEKNCALLFNIAFKIQNEFFKENVISSHFIIA